MSARFECGRVLASAALVLLAVCGWLASGARGYVYWSTCNYGTVGRANLDGTHVDETFIKNLKNPTALAVGPGYIYWLTPGSAFGPTGSVARANANGRHVIDRFVTPASSIYPATGALVRFAIRRALAVDGAHVYYASHWVESAYLWGEEIDRANLGGGLGHDLVDTSKTEITPAAAIGRPITYETPTALAAGSSHVYWANPKLDTIGKATSVGKHPEEYFITGAAKVTGIAVGVNRTYLYWSSADGTVGRADLNGAHVEHRFIKGLDKPRGVAVDSSYIYWVNANGTIGRANLDGTGVDQKFITGANFACGLAVNSGGKRPLAAALPSHVVVPPPQGATKPSNTSRPVISGSVQEGSTLTASDGTWSGSTPISFTYQWRLCSSLGAGCTDITGDTAQTYVVSAPDVGNTLDMLVTARNTAGSAYAVSAVTAKVNAAPGMTATAVTVTTEGLAPFTFTLSTATQPKIVSDTPAKAELNVPPGTVTFTVSNPYSNILSHTFEVCTTPLAKPVTTLPGVQALPNSCTGEVTPLLAPGGATATLTVDLKTPGAYEYLSTANNPGGDASSGMKGVLNIT